MHRRTFIAGGAAAVGSLAAAEPAQFRKSIAAVIFPREMPMEEQFRRAKDAGFEGIELRMGDHVKIDSTQHQLRRWGDAARSAGITIVSLWVSEPLSPNPLNSPDPEVRARGVRALEKSIDFATWLGCGA